MRSPSRLSVEEQRQGIWFQKVIARISGSNWGRRYLAGAAIGSASLYALQMFQGGPIGEPIGEPIGLPGIPLGGLVGLGAFFGSAVLGGPVTLAGIIRNDPTLQHYASAAEVWLKYRLGRMSPRQYFALGAVLDYQRLYGPLPPDARDKTQADFVREAVRWRMDSKKKSGGRKRASHKSRNLGE
jgi:hypothetical protein